MMKHMCIAASRILVVGAVVGAAATARADAVLPTNMLPPQGVYASTNSVSFLSGLIVISDIQLHSFLFQTPPQPVGGSGMYDFSGTADALVSISSGPFTPYSAPTNSFVFVNHVFDIGAVQHFDTEMLSLNLSGGSLPPGVLIRESPTMASLGHLTIEPLGSPLVGPDGPYHISSFFDVFTELSLDGGQTWNPASNSVHMALEPAPGSLVALVIGLCTTRRRRR